MRNGKGSGCLAAIIAFSFIGGNTFLFTGMKNLEDNPIAWLMVVFAVIADACAIGFIISFIAKHIGKRKNVNGIGSANHDINYSPVTDNQEKDNISTTINLKKETTFFQTDDNDNKGKVPNDSISHDDSFTISNQVYSCSMLDNDNNNMSDDNEKIDQLEFTEQEDLRLERQKLFLCLNALYQNRMERERLIGRFYFDLLTIQKAMNSAEATEPIEKQQEISYHKPLDQTMNDEPSTIINTATNALSSKDVPDWVCIGALIRHHLYGTGKIQSIDGNTAIVVFRSLKKTYAFPDAFIQGILQQVSDYDNRFARPKQKSASTTENKSHIEVETKEELSNNEICKVVSKERNMRDSATEFNNEASTVSKSKESRFDTTDSKESTPIPWGKVELNKTPDSPYKAQPISISSKSVQMKASGNTKINWNQVVAAIRNIRTKSNPPYPKGFYSREFEIVDKQRAQTAYQFYQQASYLKNISGHYSHNDFGRYHVSSFAFISLDELKHYVSWRTSFEDGSTIVEEKYFELYLNELINHLRNNKNTKEHLQNTIDLIWANYHLKYGKVNQAVWENNVLRFVEGYRDRQNLIPEIRQFLIDYYMMSSYPVSAEEFNEMLPAELKMVPRTIEKPKSKKYSDSLELLDSISDYHFIDKAFYKSAYGYLLPKAIDYVFADIEEYLMSANINWYQAVFYTSEKDKKDWFPFLYYLYYPGECINDKSIELVNGDTYIIKNGKCYKLYIPYRANLYSGAIGYTIKLIDNELRKALGFKSKLQPNKEYVMWGLQRYEDSGIRNKYEKKLDIFTSSEYEDLVKNSTNQFFNATGIDRMIMSAGYQKRKEAERRKAEKAKEQEKKKAEREKKKLLEKMALETGQSVADLTLEPLIVEFDRSKFDDIRKKSAEIQSVLIIEEETEQDIISANIEEKVEKPITHNKEITEDQHVSDNEFVLLINSLDAMEKEVLLRIISGDPVQRISSFVILHDNTLESVADSINRKSLDTIGDNIIELSDEVIIYEDYFDEIKSALEEE